MANEFNSFFINIGQTLADKITTGTNFKTYLQKVKKLITRNLSSQP